MDINTHCTRHVGGRAASASRGPGAEARSEERGGAPYETRGGIRKGCYLQYLFVIISFSTTFISIVLSAIYNTGLIWSGLGGIWVASGFRRKSRSPGEPSEDEPRRGDAESTVAFASSPPERDGRWS